MTRGTFRAPCAWLEEAGPAEVCCVELQLDAAIAKALRTTGEARTCTDLRPLTEPPSGICRDTYQKPSSDESDVRLEPVELWAYADSRDHRASCGAHVPAVSTAPASCMGPGCVSLVGNEPTEASHPSCRPG